MVTYYIYYLHLRKFKFTSKIIKIYYTSTCYRFLVALLIDRYICYRTSWRASTSDARGGRHLSSDHAHSPLYSAAPTSAPGRGSSSTYATRASTHASPHDDARHPYAYGAKSSCNMMRAKVVCTLLLLLALVVFMNMSLTSGVFLVSI